jgi:hypothetical protein
MEEESIQNEDENIPLREDSSKIQLKQGQKNVTM